MINKTLAFLSIVLIIGAAISALVHNDGAYSIVLAIAALTLQITRLVNVLESSQHKAVPVLTITTPNPVPIAEMLARRSSQTVPPGTAL